MNRSAVAALKKPIRFLQRPCYPRAISFVEQLLQEDSWAQKPFSKKCSKWLAKKYKAKSVFLTSSATQSFYLAVSLMGLEPGDEVILPSYTHPSTANAFAAAAAALVFVDIDPQQMVLSIDAVEKAIGPRTRAIVAVHYGGFAANMPRLQRLVADQERCILIEDTAHALLATQGGQLLGSFGQMACLSFENQKNISCGEGGALLLHESQFSATAEIAYETGTNKAAYLRGEVETYSWCGVGAKYIPSELTLAYLWAGFQDATAQLKFRRRLWHTYHEQFQALKLPIGLPEPSDPGHNAHLYYLLLSNQQQREDLQQHLKRARIETHTHYIPLHSSSYGQRYRFFGKDTYTTSCSQRLLRLPLHTKLTVHDVKYVTQEIARFFS